MHRDILTLLGTRSSAFDQFDISETGCRLDLIAAGAEHKESGAQNGEANDDAKRDYFGGRGRGFLGVSTPRIAPSLTGFPVMTLRQRSFHLTYES